MNCPKPFASWACMLAFCTVPATGAPASEPVRKTAFSINEPLEVPGMMLEPGRYVMKLVELEAHRNVLEVFETVQLWSPDETRLLSTLLTMPNYDLPTTDKTVFSFFERGPKQPKALRLWFAPGRNYSQEFVYPKSQAVELAKVVGRGVLAMPPELPGDIGRLARMVVEPTPAASKAPLVSTGPGPSFPSPPASVPARRITPVSGAPRQTAVPVQSARPVQAAPVNAAPPAEPDAVSAARTSQSRARLRDPKPATGALPKTGSFLPVFASLGLLALAAGSLLRILALRLERT